MYILSRLTSSGAVQNVVSLKENKYHVPVQDCVCFCCFHWNRISKKCEPLKTNVQLKTVFTWFISFMAGILCLIFRKSPRLLQGHVRSQHRSSSQATLFPAAIHSTLGGHFTFSYAFFPLPLGQKKTATLWRWLVNFISVWRALLYLCLLCPPPPPPHFPTRTHTHTHTHTHCLHWQQTHSCHTVSARRKSLRWPYPTQIFTVDSQVLGQLSWQELTSVLLFDTRHEWKTRQTRFPHKGLEGPSSVSEAACSPGFTRVHTHTHTHTHTHNKKPFSSDLICCIFHGSHQRLFCVRWHYFINQLHCIL